MRSYRRRRVIVPFILSSALDLSQLHAAAALPRNPLHMGAESAPLPQNQSEYFREQKKFPHPGIELRIIQFVA